MVNVGDVLDNGGRVHAVLHAGSVGALVLCEREHERDKWVVWRVNLGNRSEPIQCWGGNYFNNIELAFECFEDRSKHVLALMNIRDL